MWRALLIAALALGFQACTTGECSEDADCLAGSTCISVGLGSKDEGGGGSTSSCNECPPISECEIQPDVGCPVFDPDMVGQACNGQEGSNFEIPGPGICSCAGDCLEGDRAYCNP